MSWVDTGCLYRRQPMLIYLHYSNHKYKKLQTPTHKKMGIAYAAEGVHKHCAFLQKNDAIIKI